MSALEPTPDVLEGWSERAIIAKKRHDYSLIRPVILGALAQAIVQTLSIISRVILGIEAAGVIRDSTYIAQGSGYGITNGADLAP